MNATTDIDGPTTHPMRVLLVDRREIVHFGFRRLLMGESWVGRLVAASGSAEALDLTRKIEPDVAMVGAELGGESAMELARDITEASPLTRVLVISSDPISARRALSMGAAGVVPRTWRGEEILRAARSVALGMAVFASEPPRGSRLLTDRELEILELIAAGATNREIAASIGLSTNTVKEHASALYRKMKARNRAEAILRARRLGLLG